MRIVAKDKCHVCGRKTEFLIDDKATLLREAVCSFCGASLRASDIVGVIQEKMSAMNTQMKIRGGVLAY